MEEQEFFQEALSNFTYEVACMGAIRNRADLGESVSKIHWELDFPMSYAKEADKAAYMTCDYGILQSKDPGTYEELLSCLVNGQREYMEGIPRRSQRCYFKVQEPMRGILFRLCEKQQYEGSIYFFASEMKMNIVRY